MSHTTAPERATRRTTVRQLAGQGMSQRAIAAHLKISKDTVRRDLNSPEDTVRHPDAPPEPAGAPAPADTAVRITLALDAADEDLRRDLATLLSAGQSLDDIVRTALALTAQAYEAAWDYGDWPVGTAPRLRRPGYHPYDPVTST
jgi:transposase